jgi:hypothetical protein
MANHKGERECVTCRFHVDTATGIYCQKYSSDIPIERGPYLICRFWEGYDGQTLNDGWKNKYLPREDVLYQYDIYMINVPQVVKEFTR